jgi:hypothetical protein
VGAARELIMRFLKSIKFSLDHILEDKTFAFLLSIFIALIFFFLGIFWSSLSEFTKFEKRNFRNFFGNNIKEASDIIIVSDMFCLREDIRKLDVFLAENNVEFSHIKDDIENITKRPFIKHLQHRIPWYFSGYKTNGDELDRILNYRTLVAISYLNSECSKIFREMPQIVFDEDRHKKWGEGTFFCVGHPATNIMSEVILNKEERVTMGNDGISILEGDTVIENYKRPKKIYLDDYGIILKKKNEFDNGHSFIVCAGLGEWGTSASAHYLAKNWKKLYEKFGKEDFIIVLKVLNSDDAVSVKYKSKLPKLED